MASLTFKIGVPVPTAAHQRRPQYVSQATASISIALLNPPVGFIQPPVTNVTPGTGNCPQVGQVYQCTITANVPPGSDTFTVTAYSGTNATGSVLSQQIPTLTVLAGQNNVLSFTLDANAVTMTISGSGSCQNGPVGTAFGSVGTTPVTFTVTYTDAQGKTIVAPGLPKLEIQDNTALYQTSAGTINGTGGTIAFTVNQATQTFTLTPSNSSTTNASVNVKAVPANTNGTSDGLAFSKTKSFTFATGPAPPANRFLAEVEQTGAGSGQVDFFNITVDGGNNPNGFGAFSPATLAVTQSTNDNTQNDVDNPVSLAWDSTGDLLVGNGGSTGNGNLACVPVGAISTGANSSTTVTQNVHDPVGLAYEPRNGTVAVGNNANTGTSPLAEYTLTGNYTASTTLGATNLHVAGGTISGELINMPSLATGTFAATLTDGCEVDPAHKSCAGAGTSQVVIFNGSSITTTMTDTSTFHIDEPWGIGYDSTHSQLVIANFGAWHPSVSLYTTAGAYVKSDGHDYFGNSQNPFLIAANGTGLFAVAYTTAFSSDQVQIYTNGSGATAPTPLFGPIPYNAMTDPTCSDVSTYVYGSSAIVTSMIWLSNTRLLVAVQTSKGGANGLYIYDTASSTTPAGQYDDQFCTPVGAMPAQKAFQLITHKPLAAAYKQ